MLWLQVVKIIMKHSKKMMKEFKIQKSPTDDTPNVLTKDEICMVVSECLLDAAPEIVELFSKRRK
jgi:hypothetical protein